MTLVKRTTFLSLLCLVGILFPLKVVLSQSPDSAAEQFQQQVQPILSEFCFGCHADGGEEGNMSFDALLASKDPEQVKQTWHRVFKQLQSDLMPPFAEDQPSDEQIETVKKWIKFGAFGFHPDNPNPGKVTIRRLNQVEYRNTIRDLIGVDYDTSLNFPSDDSGHGFDNMSDVLTVSTLLLEKYINAANEIISTSVPQASTVMRERIIHGSEFKIVGKEVDSEQEQSADQPSERSTERRRRPERLSFSYYEDTTAQAEIEIEFAGKYQLVLQIEANESYVDDMFDQNKCEFVFSLDGEELVKREFVRQGGKVFAFPFERTLDAGKHSLVASVKSLSKEEQVRKLRIDLESISLVGPDDKSRFVKPAGYERFFPRDVPEDAAARRDYARELLKPFVTRAFRRPVDEVTLGRLVSLAETTYQQDGNTFEAGIAKAMTAILASPRFLFREELVEVPGSPAVADGFPDIDEHSLASRLSYFFWSTMPDEELIKMADGQQLRNNLDAQVSRMLKDKKSQAFAENFVGQWLKSRAIESIQISERSVLRREMPFDPEAEKIRERFFELIRKRDQLSKAEEEELNQVRDDFRKSFNRGPQIDLNYKIRRAMKLETEMLFEHIINNDRSLLELVDCDYTFLNETLANYYEIPDVVGDQMRMVKLPSDSLRGGVLTQGTALIVTSNPDRTSPVKRGLYILENLLGTPIPPAPPDIPPLEDATAASHGKPVSLRETLAIHRKNALCSSCHNSMDPLGLALENFNALGRYRDQEFGDPVDTSATLATGESLKTVKELKHILATNRRKDLYRCITEKMLMYALGRDLDYLDVQTVDEIVAQLEASNGRASSLINGIVHSAAFQKTQLQPAEIQPNESLGSSK